MAQNDAAPCPHLNGCHPRPCRVRTCHNGKSLHSPGQVHAAPGAFPRPSGSPLPGPRDYGAEADPRVKALRVGWQSSFSSSGFPKRDIHVVGATPPGLRTRLKAKLLTLSILAHLRINRGWDVSRDQFSASNVEACRV